MKFGAVLKALIAKRNITIRDLANAVSIRESTIKTWLRGSSPRDLSEVKALSRYFGVSLEYLLFGEEEPPQTLEELPLVDLYDGWLRVRIQAPGRSRDGRIDQETL